MCQEAQTGSTSALFPLIPAALEALRVRAGKALATENAGLSDYAAFLETICGATDDSQPVEQYNGNLSVATTFVSAHQPIVGQIQWNANLAASYTNPGNVSGVRWCSWTLISNDLYPAGWRRQVTRRYPKLGNWWETVLAACYASEREPTATPRRGHPGPQARPHAPGAGEGRRRVDRRGACRGAPGAGQEDAGRPPARDRALGRRDRRGAGRAVRPAAPATGSDA